MSGLAEFAINAEKLGLVSGLTPEQVAVLLHPKDLLRRTTVVAVPPTITYATAAPTGKRIVLPITPGLQVLGAAAYDSATQNMLTGQGQVGISALLTNCSDITLRWRCQAAAQERFMVFLGGQPCTTAPETPSVTTAAGTNYSITVTFAAPYTGQIDIFSNAISALVGVYVPYTAGIQATPPKRKIYLVGDSFLGGSAMITDPTALPAYLLSMHIDAAIMVSGLSGTGYVNPGLFQVYSDSARVARAAAWQPDEIVFLGSVNDDGLSGIADAAQATFLAYRNACPRARISVLGPQPSSATVTISANRTANNGAVKQAAINAGLSFTDLIGTADGAVAAFSSSTSYQPGALVTHLGSVWRHDSTIAATYGTATLWPGASAGKQWTLITAGYFGTGRVGTTTGDGPRDVMLGSDAIHPTAIGTPVFETAIYNVVNR